MAEDTWLEDALNTDLDFSTSYTQPEEAPAQKSLISQESYGEPTVPGTPAPMPTPLLPEMGTGEPEWGFDVSERITKSAQESFGTIWGGIALMSDSVGMDQARDWAINRSNELFEKAANHDIVSTQFSEISNPIDLGKFTAEKIIEYLPDLVLMAAGGAGVGTAAAKMGTTAVGKTAAKKLINRSLQKNLKAAITKMGVGVESKAVRELAYKTTLKEMGTLTGMASFEGFQGAGQMYAEDVALRGVEDASPGGAAIAGVGQAAIAMISPFNRAIAGLAVKRGIRNVASMTIGEAVEEVSQGGIEKLHAAGIDPYLTVGDIFSDPQTYMELAEAGFVGMLVGGVYGGAGEVAFGRKGDEDSKVVDPEDGDLVEESAKPKKTPWEQEADKLEAYFSAAPGTYSALPQTGSVLTAEGKIAPEALPEVPTATAEELISGEVPVASPEVARLQQEAQTEAYEPRPPLLVGPQPQTQLQIDEAKAKKDTFDSWANRFAPNAAKKRDLTTVGFRQVANKLDGEMEAKMANIEQDSNDVKKEKASLPTQLVERNKAIKAIKVKEASITKRAEEVVSTVTTPPTKEELEAQRSLDITAAMENVGGETAGIGAVYGTGVPSEQEGLRVEAVATPADAVAAEVIKAKEAEVAPKSEDSRIQQVLDFDSEGLAETLIAEDQNPKDAVIELGFKVREFLEAEELLNTPTAKRAMETLAAAVEKVKTDTRKGAAKTGNYKWEVSKGIATTSDPKTGKVLFSVVPQLTKPKGFILVDGKGKDVGAGKVFKTSIAARKSLETIKPKATPSKVKAKATQKKKATVKQTKGRVSAERKAEILAIAEDTKDIATLKEEAKAESAKAAETKPTKKVEKKKEAKVEEKVEEKPEPVKTISVEQYKKEQEAAKAITSKTEMAKKMEDFFGQFDTERSKGGATFKPTTLGEGIAKVLDYVSGVAGKTLKAIVEGGKGKFENIEMNDIASFPKEQQDKFRSKIKDGFAKEGGKVAFKGMIIPVRKDGRFVKWAILYDSSVMTDKQVVDMMIHEGLHGVTLNELKTNKKFNKQVTSLRTYIINQYVKDPAVRKELSKITTSKQFTESELMKRDDAKILYGLINNGEFLAAANLDEGFREVAKGLKARRSDSILKNAWAELKYLIGRIFGMGKKESTYLDEVFNITEKVIKVTPTEFSKDGMAGQLVTPEGTTAATQEAETSAARMERDRAYVKKNKVAPEGVKSKSVDFLKSSWKMFQDTFATVSERLRRSYPRVFNAMRKMEFNIHQTNLAHLKEVNSFIKGMKGVSVEDEFSLSRALKNGDTKTRDTILAKYNLTRDFKGVESVLKDIEKRADDVGLLDIKIENYFPRSVKDPDGLMSHYADDPDTYGRVQYEIEMADKASGYTLSEADKAGLVTQLLSSGSYNHIPVPGASKKRRINYVVRELNQYYHTSTDSLVSHIIEMNDKIEARVMMGKSTRPTLMAKITRVVGKIEALTGKETLTPTEQSSLDGLDNEYQGLYAKLKNVDAELDESVSNFILKDSKEKGSAEQAIELVRSRLKQRGTYGAVATARNIAYAITLGSPTSAITQIGDLTWSIYRNNPINTMRGAAKAIRLMINKKGLTQEHFDFAHALQEMGGASSNQLLDTVLKWTGLKGMDIFAKETAMQSTLMKWAKKDSRESFIKTHTSVFGSKVAAAKVWKDINQGKMTEDALFAVYNDLSDWQPISLMEMPKGYLEAGNLRVFYMLKTFSIKALNSIHREVYTEFKKGDYEAGARKLIGLTLTLSLSGAAADEIKDFLLGKESSIKDNTIDNMIQLFMVNKYAAARGMKTDSFMTSMVDSFIPPVRFADDFVADLYAASSKDKDFKFKTLKDVPLVGKVLWSHMEYGREAELKGRKEDIYKDIRSTVSKRGVSGKETRIDIRQFNRDTREYNKGKRGDARLSPITSTTIKNLKRRERKKESK